MQDKRRCIHCGSFLEKFPFEGSCYHKNDFIRHRPTQRTMFTNGIANPFIKIEFANNVIKLFCKKCSKIKNRSIVYCPLR
jgi:hypothetical protein